ncbi:MAG: TolC family protein [Desulfobacterium sp.]|nr:TolC family protein [Desulfobacterium sp.]
MPRLFYIMCLLICLPATEILSQPFQARALAEEIAKWPVLTLEQTLKLGLEKNLNLKLEALNIPIARETLTAEEAFFDPSLASSMSAQTQKTPADLSIPESGSGNEFPRMHTYSGDIGLSKKFATGLDTSLSFRTLGNTTTSSFEGLDPQYRGFLVLNLTQPLLQGYGTKVNTTDIRIARNSLEQSSFTFLSRVQGLVADIETAYYSLAQAIEIYRYRLESRQLAQQLLAGNREKFDLGMIPISEVQETLTALASRDEQVIAARQQMETEGNRLKDLLEINSQDPMEIQRFRTEPLPATRSDLPSLERALPLALANRPELEEQRLEITGQEIRIALAKNQTLPRLDLNATLGLNGLSGETTGLLSTPLEGNYFDSIDRMAQGDGYETLAELRFAYPLGNRGGKARYQRTRLEKRQKIYALKRRETTVETQVIDGLITVGRSLERVEVAARFQELARITLDQEMERLHQGLSNTFRILDFQDNVIEARIRRATALGDFNRGVAALYWAMGGNLERLGIVYNAYDRTTKSD